MKKKRTQLEIVHDMLSSIQQKGGRIKPTHLLYRSNLSYKLLQEYITLLTGQGLLLEEAHRKDPGKKEYVITDKGLKFLFEYKRIAEFTDAFGL
jgi:predicted transcriptional regulator